MTKVAAAANFVSRLLRLLCCVCVQKLYPTRKNLLNYFAAFLIKLNAKH